MEKTKLNKLDLDVFSEKLDNGLRVFVVNIPNIKNIYATFSTNYGSVKREFVPINEDKMVQVPDGVAHFLEHKMFEQPDGIDPFTFFSERGSDANANTNNFKTTYLFSGPDFFEENINYLIDYVQNPYFTDENVLKEKGIIEQEIKMYQDDPYTVIYEGLIYNTFINHPIKYPVIGTIESINSITKEDLYTCYNTFYHPSNMFVVITGNVEPEKVINIIKNNQSNKTFDDAKEIKIKDYKEPDEVAKPKEVKEMNINIPKLAIAYKINISHLKMDIRNIIKYMYIFTDIIYGDNSNLVESLKNEGIINDYLGINIMDVDDHLVIAILGESEKPEELEKRLFEAIHNVTITDIEVERKKKVLISSLIYMSDNLYSINHKIMNNLIKYNKVIDNDYDDNKNLNIHELEKLLKSLDFSNTTTFTLLPKKTNES